MIEVVDENITYEAEFARQFPTFGGAAPKAISHA